MVTGVRTSTSLVTDLRPYGPRDSGASSSSSVDDASSSVEQQTSSSAVDVSLGNQSQGQDGGSDGGLGLASKLSGYYAQLFTQSDGSGTAAAATPSASPLRYSQGAGAYAQTASLTNQSNAEELQIPGLPSVMASGRRLDLFA